MDKFNVPGFLQCVKYNPKSSLDIAYYFMVNVAHYLGNPLIVKDIVTDSDKDTDSNLQSLLCKLGESMIQSGVGDSYGISSIPASLVVPRVILSLYKNGHSLLSMRITYNTESHQISLADFSYPDSYRFSVEFIIASKILAIYKEALPRCPEDLYDIYCLSELFDLDIWGICKLINKHTDRVNVWYGSYPLKENQVQYLTKSYDMWMQDTSEEYKKYPVKFRELLQRFHDLMGGILDPVKNTNWSHNIGILVWNTRKDQDDIEEYSRQMQKNKELHNKE